MADQNIGDTNTKARFGTFGGVFTPCSLTILGVIMFLRFGEVVGNAGILRAIIIVCIAKLITTLTTLSLSAIATNTKVKGGGAYYLISRSLGVEFGGAIGVVFYLSQAVSVALYVIGFTEVLLSVAPALAEIPRITATVVNVVVFVCVFIGAGWTIKVQYGILTILLLSIASFVIGAAKGWSPELLASNWSPSYEEGQNYWVMFALFFPAVTGIMAGANMSGDLKNPGRSIPLGTLTAILFTGLVYISFAFLLGASSTREALQTSSLVVANVSIFPLLIIAGVFAATLSSALGSMMGAPRILQALARDKVLPILNPFAKGSGPSGEPRRATILSFLIAEAGVMLGDLDAIAPVITMFFMITYGAINLATFMESFSGNPSYRPTFKWCHWSLALVGALFCGGVMLLINPLWAAIAVVVMVGLYKYLQRQELKVSWGDVVSGSMFENVRRDLLRLEDHAYHEKNWRPAVIAMGTGSDDRLALAVLGRRLAGSHGLLMLGQVFTDKSEEMLERHESVQGAMRKLISDNGLDAFPAITFAPDLSAGVSSLIQCSGIGAMRPNMVLFGWNQDSATRQSFEENIRTVVRLGRSVAVSREHLVRDDPWDMPSGTIDIWWQGQGANGHLMLLLAHVLCGNQDLRGRTIRMIRMLPSEAGRAETLEHLAELSKEVRIPCKGVVVVGDDFREAVQKESGSAALVLLGMANPCEANDDYLDRLDSLVGDLPNVLFVYSAGDMDLHA